MKSLIFLILLVGVASALNVAYEHVGNDRHYLFVAKPDEQFTPWENMTCTSTVWSCRMEQPGIWEFSFFSDSASDATAPILSADESNVTLYYNADEATYERLLPLIQAQELLIVAPGLVIECISYDWQCE